MRYLISLGCFIIAGSLFAHSTLPKGCQGVAVQGETVALKSKKNKLFFIHNLTNTDLWITHPTRHADGPAGWTTRLQSNNWSALAMNMPSFVLNCIESRPGHEQQIPCEGAIAICQWNGVKVPASEQGIFWAAEDKSLAALKAALSARGFMMPND